MNYNVKKEVIIKLTLSQEELSTIVASYGSSDYSYRDEIAEKYRWNIVDDADQLYSDLKALANSIQ